MVRIEGPLDVLLDMRRDLRNESVEDGRHVVIPLSLDRIVPQPEYVLKSVELNNGGTPDNVWYHWRLMNLGTKWDAYAFGFDNGSPEDMDPLFHPDEGKWVLWFYTAWSPPCDSVFLSLVKRYPTIKVKHAYADEDIGYGAGIRYYEMRNGRPTLVDGVCKDGDTDWCNMIIDRQDIEE